jgi:hypothetical protein
MDNPREQLKALITPEMVRCLAEVFPDRSPSLSDPDRHVWYRAGQASVPQFLLTLLEEIADANNSLTH